MSGLKREMSGLGNEGKKGLKLGINKELSRANRTATTVEIRKQQKEDAKFKKRDDTGDDITERLISDGFFSRPIFSGTVGVHGQAELCRYTGDNILTAQVPENKKLVFLNMSAFQQLFWSSDFSYDDMCKRFAAAFQQIDMDTTDVEIKDRLSSALTHIFKIIIRQAFTEVIPQHRFNADNPDVEDDNGEMQDYRLGYLENIEKMMKIHIYYENEYYPDFKQLISGNELAGTSSSENWRSIIKYQGNIQSSIDFSNDLQKVAQFIANNPTLKQDFTNVFSSGTRSKEVLRQTNSTNLPHVVTKEGYIEYNLSTFVNYVFKVCGAGILFLLYFPCNEPVNATERSKRANDRRIQIMTDKEKYGNLHDLRPQPSRIGEQEIIEINKYLKSLSGGSNPKPKSKKRHKNKSKSKRRNNRRTYKKKARKTKRRRRY